MFLLLHVVHYYVNKCQVAQILVPISCFRWPGFALKKIKPFLFPNPNSIFAPCAVVPNQNYSSMFVYILCASYLCCFLFLDQFIFCYIFSNTGNSFSKNGRCALEHVFSTVPHRKIIPCCIFFYNGLCYDYYFSIIIIRNRDEMR